MRNMAGSGSGPFDEIAQKYLDVRPKYPSEWYTKLSALTPSHSLAWDVGTGTGQAAVAVAEYYEQVVATDISEELLKHGIQHPKVKYVHTPLSLSEDELVSMVGGENGLDLITVATAIHWFDIPKFYSVVNRVLRKPGGVIAVWGYDGVTVSPEVDALSKKFRESAKPFYNPQVEYLLEEYRNLPFPFESVGLGTEGHPVQLDMPIEMPFERFVDLLNTASVVIRAKQRGVDLVSEDVVKEYENAWGGPGLIRTVRFKAVMLAGRIRV